MTNPIRIGMVNFINTAPLYETWKATIHRPDWLIIEGSPVELNHGLAEGNLDLGFISSHEYAMRPNNYLLLSDLSISSQGAVGSVVLFLEDEITELDGKTVFLSQASQTSNALVKIVLEEFIGVRPNYAFSASSDLEGQPEKNLLAIGDRALRLKEKGRYRKSIDLGEIWQRQTGLPFVFAVWAVRQEFYDQKQEAVREIHRKLVQCSLKGRENLAAICRASADKIPMPVEECQEYLTGIEFDLNGEKIKALEHFYTYLITRGEADSGSVPLQFVSL